MKISLIPPKIKEAKSRRVKLIYNALSLLLLVGTMGLYLWNMIPREGELKDRLAKINGKIAKYEEYKGQLLELKEKKDMLITEYKMYAVYPARAVNVAAPLAALTDSIKGDAWIKSVNMEKNKVVTTNGAIESEAKVDGLRQLSDLRLSLEKYCDKVDVEDQDVSASGGLSFSLKLQGFPTLSKIRELQAKEEEKIEAQKDKVEEKTDETANASAEKEKEA